MSEEKEKVKLLIIGSGPAGYTAAIYASRANLEPVLYQGIEPGGQLMITTDVENYPGYPDGIQGPAMMEEFKKQAERMGADIRYGMVEKVDFSGDSHLAYVGDKEIEADAVVLATGASAKWLGIPSEKRLNGSGVSACAVCDGFFYKNMDVAIVGGGDTACEEALYLSNLCTNVYMLVRRGEMRASKIMQERVLDSKNIQIFWHTETDEILGENEVEGVRVVNNETGEKQELKIQGFFVAIGHKPNSDIFKDYIEVDDQGYVTVEAGTTSTNVKGVFASGDLMDKYYRQAVTAAGTGCMAALDAERYIAEKAHAAAKAQEA